MKNPALTWAAACAKALFTLRSKGSKHRRVEAHLGEEELTELLATAYMAGYTAAVASGRRAVPDFSEAAVPDPAGFYDQSADARALRKAQQLWPENLSNEELKRQLEESERHPDAYPITLPMLRTEAKRRTEKP